MSLLKSTSQMKAVVFEKFGGPEVLQVQQVAKPEPKRGEVRVRVRAAGINMLDSFIRSEPAPWVKVPHILGSDISGEVDAIGDAVYDWKPGQEVILYPLITCGICELCKSGDENQCQERKVIGDQTNGGYAEYIVVPERNLIKKPERLSHEEAATIPLAFTTAYHMIFNRGKLKPGERALVMGGSGGVGSAAVQLCKVAGAWVATTVGSDAKARQAKEIGADAVFLHGEDKWQEKVLKATEDNGVDLVIEHMGGRFTEAAIDAMARKGRMVAIGSTAGNELKLRLDKFYQKQLSLLGSYVGVKAELQSVVKLFESNNVKPLVDKSFSLDKAADAHKYLAKREHFGKVVLKVK